MFPTGTKTDARPVTMEELKEIRRAVKAPIVVIGGINLIRWISSKIRASTDWRWFPP